MFCYKCGKKLKTEMKFCPYCGSSASEFFYYDINSYQKDKEIIDLLKTASPIKQK